MPNHKYTKAKKLLDAKIGEDDGLNTERILRDFSSVVALLSSDHTHQGKLAKSVSTISVALSVSSIIKSIYDYVRKVSRNANYTIKVNEDDNLFRISEKWLMDALPDEKKLSVFAHSSTTTTPPIGNPMDIFDDDGPTPPATKVRVNTSYDGSIEQEIVIAGYTVKVSTNKPETEAKNSNGKQQQQARYADRVIVFTCPSPEAKNAVLHELESQAQKLKDIQPGLFTSRWGGFERVSDLPKRTRESVVLKEGQMEEIMGYLQRFKANEAVYRKIGVPFRTGILLYGAPGSGKSSTAAVIANELRMNLYYISLKGMDDETLLSCSSRIPANSVVVLEDIDVCRAVKDREATDGIPESVGEVSMSAVLNVLDGFQSPPGVVFVMTTNRIEVLDDAILRPGRMDLKSEIGYLDTHQLRGVIQYFTGSIPEYVPSITEADEVSSAEIVKIVRDHIPNIEECGPDIISYVEGRLLTKLEH